MAKPKVSQSTINQIKTMGMTKAVKKANSTTASSEFIEGAKRMYPGKVNPPHAGPKVPARLGPERVAGPPAPKPKPTTSASSGKSTSSASPKPSRGTNPNPNRRKK